MENKNLTAEHLRFLLNYCPESGVFTWKNPQASNVKAGQVAGTDDGKGYLLIGINGKLYKAHRLAWLYVTGEWPAGQIDHINRCKSDNRLCNLRIANGSQNQMNKFHPNNTSGVKGVYWNKQRGKWQAQIQVHGKGYNLGRYADIRDAAEAYQAIARIIHGEFNHFGEQ